MEDIVITSYKDQIKQSILKAEAVKEAGFDIVVDELEKKGIKTKQLKDFFNQIINSYTIEDLNKLTLEDLITVIDDINDQVTKNLVAKVEIADALVRRSKLVSLNKSPNGKIPENDNYTKVGTNLAAQINKDGIASGINICIRNYCNQKIYQANYREKIKEKEQELGIFDEDKVIENKNIINEKITSTDTNNIDPKEKLLKEIFDKDITDNYEGDFYKAKEEYRNYINRKMEQLKDQKRG